MSHFDFLFLWGVGGGQGAGNIVSSPNPNHFFFLWMHKNDKFLRCIYRHPQSKINKLTAFRVYCDFIFRSQVHVFVLHILWGILVQWMCWLTISCLLPLLTLKTPRAMILLTCDRDVFSTDPCDFWTSLNQSKNRLESFLKKEEEEEEEEEDSL